MEKPFHSLVRNISFPSSVSKAKASVRAVKRKPKAGRKRISGEMFGHLRENHYFREYI